MNNKFNYEEWKKEYYKKEIVDLKKYLNQDDLDIIEKLRIKIENKIYTENEFEGLNFEQY